jgi:hypothetical protein
MIFLQNCFGEAERTIFRRWPDLFITCFANRNSEFTPSHIVDEF